MAMIPKDSHVERAIEWNDHRLEIGSRAIDRLSLAMWSELGGNMQSGRGFIGLERMIEKLSSKLWVSKVEW